MRENVEGPRENERRRDGGDVHEKDQSMASSQEISRQI